MQPWDRTELSNLGGASLAALVVLGRPILPKLRHRASAFGIISVIECFGAAYETMHPAGNVRAGVTLDTLIIQSVAVLGVAVQHFDRFASSSSECPLPKPVRDQAGETA